MCIILGLCGLSSLTGPGFGSTSGTSGDPSWLSMSPTLLGWPPGVFTLSTADCRGQYVALDIARGVHYLHRWVNGTSSHRQPTIAHESFTQVSKEPVICFQSSVRWSDSLQATLVLSAQSFVISLSSDNNNNNYTRPTSTRGEVDASVPKAWAQLSAKVGLPRWQALEPSQLRGRQLIVIR